MKLHLSGTILCFIFMVMALWKYLKTPKDGLPDTRGSLLNEVPSRIIEQANQEVRQLRSAQGSAIGGKRKRGAYKRYGFK